MASGLILKATYEADNPLDVSLREAFQLLQPQLRPQFPLTIPTQVEYANLNRAILYGILCEPHLAEVHIEHLHVIVIDGYSLFTALLTRLVNELYTKLVENAKVQLLGVTSIMIRVSAIGLDGLLVALLRQTRGGDFSKENLWLCSELVTLFSTKWDCILEEQPLVLSSITYVFLRLLADHCRVSLNSNMEILKQKEIEFFVRVFREMFHLCLKIGRDLIRLLQDLVHVPEFLKIWKDVLLMP